MTYNRWQADWRDGPGGGTPILADFLDQVESTLVIHDGLISSADGSGAEWKLLVMPDGTLKAVPRSATATAAPTALTPGIHLSFIALTWTAPSGATSYRVNRNGVFLGASDSPVYYDGAGITIGATYTYNVIALNTYGMWSPPSATVTAFVDPVLNTVPVFDSITVWPLSPGPGENIYVHVNAHDADAQRLAMTLGVSAGTLTATADPSTWIWEES